MSDAERIAALEAEVERLTRERDEARVAQARHNVQRMLAESRLARARAALERIGRGAELQARVMRDPRRTGGWAGAERVANAFDDIADRALAVRARARAQP